MQRYVSFLLLGAVISGCHQRTAQPDNGLRVGATPVPHEALLKAAAPLLRQEGIELKIVVFNDYVQPNVRLADGDLDANFYQTAAYLQNFIAGKNLDLVSAGGVHFEPFGLYAAHLKSLDALPDGARVALPNEPSNLMRGLRLLESAGLIGLRPGTGLFGATRDISANPRHLRFVELDAAMLPRAMESADVVGINGNFALGAGLRPAEQALARETQAVDYVNIVAVRRADQSRPQVVRLLAALRSATLRRYMAETYHGAVTPAD